jgi:hypothetical protein
VATWPKAWVFCRLFSGIVVSNPVKGVDVCFLRVLCAASGRSLVQRSPTECGVSVCDREVSIMRRPCPNNGCCAVAGVFLKI